MMAESHFIPFFIIGFNSLKKFLIDMACVLVRNIRISLVVNLCCLLKASIRLRRVRAQVFLLF